MKMKVRRIVTGHDATGRAIVWQDGEATNQQSRADKLVSTLIWCTDTTPCDYTRNEDMSERKLGIAPPPHGTRFSVIEIEPGNAAYTHRTDTIDYVICVAGEIDMDLDDATVKLRAGDVMVQRGTNHAWVNRGSEPCRIAFVLVPAKPAEHGGKVLHAVG
jgi:quercetin dioxygenase-like cupin family protein